MHLYVPDMETLFAWMEETDFRYVVLRSFRDYPAALPQPGAKGDVDLLIEDAAFNPMRRRYKRMSRRRGTDCDICTASGLEDGTAYFPPAMAERILDNRVRWKDSFYVPCPADHLNSLLFMLAYYKRELSGIDATNEAIGTRSKYHEEISRLAAALGLKIPMTLLAFHRHLKAQGDMITESIWSHRLQAEFRRGRDSDFLIELGLREGFTLPALEKKGLFSFLRKKKV